MSARGPVILLGMDAVEATLVERLLEEGELPNLATLRARGVWGGLRTRPSAFLSLVWPTFLTGESLGRHGWYFNKMWNPDRQRLEYVDPGWLPYRPFYHDLDPDCRVALLDIPFLSEPDGKLNGIGLSGWQAHDDFGRWSRPRSLWGEMRHRFGRPALSAEIFGPQTARTLLRQRREALESMEQFGRVVAHLVAREHWDLLVAVFGGAHRAMHYLWSLDEVDLSGADPATRRVLEDAPRTIYRSWDRALGRVMDAASADARVLVFALHGMGPNNGWAEYFPAMVGHIAGRGEQDVPRRGIAYRLKRRIPWTVARQLTRRLPSGVNHALVPIWSRRMLDWSSTRYFALPVDLNGYLRINLRGREAEGIVSPGREHDIVIEEVTEAFRAFRDLWTGRPIVRSVEPVEEMVGSDAPRRSVLPDLIVRWANVRARGSAGIRSPFGELRWGRGRRLPSGRSGNHTPHGWFVATGPGIEPAREDATHDAVDLLPTAYHWLGATAPDRFQGRPIASAVGEPARGARLGD
ncbi:MAG: alkaline phosphatase family protein [Gemmatimonadota bacterium]